MKNNITRIGYTAIFMTYAAAGFGFIYPEQAELIVMNTVDRFNNGKDSAIRLFDTDGDGCIQPPLQDEFCISVGGYLKARIAEEPLLLEDTKQLPSFIGAPYPASPFDSNI